MQRSTVILSIVFALLLACGGLFLLGGTLSATLQVTTASAADYPKALQSIRGILTAGTAPQRFSEPLPADPADCQLEDVTITLANRGLLAAEWVSVSVEGAVGDIAVYSISGEGDTVPARSLGNINLKLISLKGSDGLRIYRIQYYVYGMKREITVIQNGEAQG